MFRQGLARVLGGRTWDEGHRAVQFFCVTLALAFRRKQLSGVTMVLLDVYLRKAERALDSVIAAKRACSEVRFWW